MEKTLYTKQSKTLIMIPVYNGEKFISKTLDSCLSQTLPTEIWVVDNCSTDETLNIVTKYTKENADVKLIVNNENYGRVGNMNRCLDLFISSQYEYIKFIFCGDELLEDSIELVEKIFLSNDDLSMVNGCYVFNGKNHSSIGSNPFSKNRRVEIQELIEKGVYPSSATGTFNSLTYSKKGIGEYRFNPLFLGISMFHNDILYTNGDIYYTNEVVGIFNVEAHASFHKQFDYFYTYEYAFTKMHGLEMSKNLFSDERYSVLKTEIALQLIVSLIKIGKLRLLLLVISELFGQKIRNIITKVMVYVK